jgi:hypothetical protein
MKAVTLSKEKMTEPEKVHGCLRDKREASRVRAVIALR